jgi:tRNA-guanine family transglycosylase
VAINAGVDVFDSYYACNLADQAKALNLQYDNGRLTGYQLLDFTNPGGSEGVEVEYDQQPLMDGCPCYACTEQYKQCYIQHLFNVHEILGLTLLTVHNLTQLQLFFGAVRQSIREGYFNELKTSFHRI